MQNLKYNLTSFIQKWNARYPDQKVKIIDEDPWSPDAEFATTLSVMGTIPFLVEFVKVERKKIGGTVEVPAYRTLVGGVSYDNDTGLTDIEYEGNDTFFTPAQVIYALLKEEFEWELEQKMEALAENYYEMEA